MKHILGIFIFSLTLANAAPATGPFFETEAAFKASQAERNKGIEAFRAGDIPTALIHMEAALSHRPNHPLLLGYVAYLAAKSGNTARAEEAIRKYTDLGILPAPEIQATLDASLDQEKAKQLYAIYVSLSEKIGKPSTIFLLPENIELVEGITVDPDGIFYFGSVVSGAIHRMDATGPTKLVEAQQHDFGSFFGIAFHAGSLYATFASIDQTPGYTDGEGQTGLAKIDPTSGQIRQVWALPGGTKGQQIADIVITRDQTLFVTDAAGRAVYQVIGDNLFPAFTHDGFGSPQGIAETSDGQLIMADYSRGLWRLDRETGKPSLLGVPSGTTLHGIDGLVWHNDNLIALQNGVSPHRILEITLSSDSSKVTSVMVKASGFNDYGEPTLGVSTPDGFYFVAGSQWPSYGKGGKLKERTEAKPTPIMRLD